LGSVCEAPHQSVIAVIEEGETKLHLVDSRD
jgi:hypothetical protein